jgi:hypothetical protein
MSENVAGAGKSVPAAASLAGENDGVATTVATTGNQGKKAKTEKTPIQHPESHFERVATTVATTDDEPPFDAPQVQKAQAKWRYEVNFSGRTWNWRRGSKGNRISRYGGTFATLPEWRQKEYERNKQKRQQARRTAQRRIRAGHAN